MNRMFQKLGHDTYTTDALLLLKDLKYWIFVNKYIQVKRAYVIYNEITVILR